MTEQEKKEITQAVLAEIEMNAQDIDRAQRVTTLDGITSFPALRNGNAIVVVPLSLLTANVQAAITQLAGLKADVLVAIGNIDAQINAKWVKSTKADIETMKAEGTWQPGVFYYYVEETPSSP